ncbi:MAG TPA: hypothetical protein VFR38_15360 [Gaiellaceae bacterium]|nr:hypothetical protein [Gaiellaceae bacterium]
MIRLLLSDVDGMLVTRGMFSIEMGNAERKVQRAARCDTAMNGEGGFAQAVHRFILQAP